MTTLLGIGTLAIGLAYVGLGLLSAAEVLLLRGVRGISRFGIGFTLMAASCGPHHVVHAMDIFAGHDHGWPLGVATLIGLPGGLVFVALRLEAMAGRRGDRFIAGTPWWVVAVPVAFLVVSGGLVGWVLSSAAAVPVPDVAAAASAPVTIPASSMGAMSAAEHLHMSGTTSGGGLPFDATSFVFVTNAFVAVTYAAVGWCLVRTQLIRRPVVGGWSVSGLALSAVFPTCALMHLVYAMVATGGPHMWFVDLLGVPASVYFLRVVRRLHDDSIIDWNRRPLVGGAAVPSRRSPWTSTTRTL